MFSRASIAPQANGSNMVHNVTRARPNRTIRCRARLLGLERSAGGRAPRSGTSARRRSRARLTSPPVLAYVGANLNRSDGFRDDGLAGGSEKQEQEGNNQAHRPYDRRSSLSRLGGLR
jgi:hypothetical protein